jgi:hypothetical protein
MREIPGRHRRPSNSPGRIVRLDDFSRRWLVRFQMIPVLPALFKEPLIRW